MLRFWFPLSAALTIDLVTIYNRLYVSLADVANEIEDAVGWAAAEWRSQALGPAADERVKVPIGHFEEPGKAPGHIVS